MALMRSPRGGSGGREGPGSATSSARGLTSSATALDKWMTSCGSNVDVVATSFDERHPATHVLDSSHNTFFATTGMFPQEFIIGLKEETRILEVKTTTKNVKKMSIARVIPTQSIASSKVVWKDIAEKEFDSHGKIQVEVHQLNNVSVKFLRFTILSAFDNFCAVFSVRIHTADNKWLC